MLLNLPLPLLSLFCIILTIRAAPISFAQVPFIFQPQSIVKYTLFQISDGYGGDAESRAAAIFKEPLERQDLSQLPYDIYDNISVMREAVEDADQQSFKSEVSRFPLDSEQGKALQVGRIKNLILLYTAAVQLIEIKSAKDVEDPLRSSEDEFDLDYASETLNSLILRDNENWGQPSRSVKWPLD